jgi:hypothetical protein
MVDVREGLRTATPVGQPPVASGYVSTLQPAPTSFDDPVYVIVPSHSTDRPYGPLAWPAIHGATKPDQGTPCWVAFDDNDTPIIVSWTGLWS